MCSTYIILDVLRYPSPYTTTIYINNYIFPSLCLYHDNSFIKYSHYPNPTTDFHSEATDYSPTLSWVTPLRSQDFETNQFMNYDACLIIEYRIYTRCSRESKGFLLNSGLQTSRVFITLGSARLVITRRYIYNTL